MTRGFSDRGGRVILAWGAAGLAIAMLTMLLGPAASALEPDDPAVMHVSYSTGKNGAKLAWLPYRPTAGELRSRPHKVVQADFQSPTTSATRGGGDPMSDPFGERTGRAPERAPTLAVDKNAKKPFRPEFLDPTTLPEQTESMMANNTPDTGSPKSNIPDPLLQQGLGRDPAEPETLPPSLEDELARNAPRGDGCPETSDFKPIGELTTDVRATSGEFPRECAFDEPIFSPRHWSPTTFTWKASGLCHKPLYFEQIQVERYGHSFGPYVQPLLSHAHFFVTVPILPYKMGVYPPNECLYTLGYYRPGSCAPYMLDPLPISVRAGLMEAGAVLGAVYLIP